MNVTSFASISGTLSQVVEVTEPPQGIGALFAAGASSCGIKALTMAHEMGTKVCRIISLHSL